MTWKDSGSRTRPFKRRQDGLMANSYARRSKCWLKRIHTITMAMAMVTRQLRRHRRWWTRWILWRTSTMRRGRSTRPRCRLLIMGEHTCPIRAKTSKLSQKPTTTKRTCNRPLPSIWRKATKQSHKTPILFNSPWSFPMLLQAPKRRQLEPLVQQGA